MFKAFQRTQQKSFGMYSRFFSILLVFPCLKCQQKQTPSHRDLEAFPSRKYESTIPVLTSSDQQTSLAVFHQLLTNPHLQLNWVFFFGEHSARFWEESSHSCYITKCNLFMISLPNTHNSCRVVTDGFFRHLDISWRESAIINLLEKKQHNDCNKPSITKPLKVCGAEKAKECRRVFHHIKHQTSRTFYRSFEKCRQIMLTASRSLRTSSAERPDRCPTGVQKEKA